jgi:hypothetical protein
MVSMVSSAPVSSMTCPAPQHPRELVQVAELAGGVAVAADERRPAGGDAVDVRAHQAVAIAAQVADADVVAPDDQNVGHIGSSDN